MQHSLLFETLFNKSAAPGIFFCTDAPFFTILLANEAFTHTAGLAGSALTGQSRLAVNLHQGQKSPALISSAAGEGMSPGFSAPVQMLQKIALTGVSYSCAPVPGVAGQWLQTVYQPYAGENGQTAWLLETTNDISELMTTRLELERALSEINLLRSELLSHAGLSMLNADLGIRNTNLNSLNDELHQSQSFLAKQNNRLELSVLRRTESLALSEARFRDLFERAPLGMTLLRGPNLIIELVNESMLHIWGRSRAEVIGKTQKESRPELEGQSILDNLNKVYATGNSLTLSDYKAFTLKGGVRTQGYFDILYQPFKDSNGQTESILVVLTDNTERVTARKETEKTQETLKLAIYAGGLGTWKANIQTGQLSASERARSIYGIAEGIALSMTEAYTLIAAKDRERVIATLQHAGRTGESFVEDYLVYPLDGSKARWVTTMGKAEFNEEGNAVYIAGTILDITERKLDDIRKNDFISMVSHELKTPLTSLKGFAQLASDRIDHLQDPFVGYALDKINIQAKKMTEMVNSFLNVSRLEAGKILLSKRLFDLNVLIGSVLDELAITSESHLFCFTPSDPVKITADEDKLGQVMHNLLSNAVKYSPRGSTIAISCETGAGMVKVTVTDEGIGITGDDSARIFERFYRVESEDTKNISGFGIGLYLSAEIVKSHQGTMQVTSTPGHGATFMFSMPAG